MARGSQSASREGEAIQSRARRAECDFNYDYGVSFRNGDKEAGKLAYNFGTEMPGLSTVVRDGDSVLRGYSTYAHGMMWVKHHDKYAPG